MSELIQRRRLYQEVADRLQRLILAGEFQVGDSLPAERELMERFGVGRPAIREALLALEKAGLIALSSGERARVVRPTAKGMVAGLDAAVRQWLADPAGIRHLQAARRLFETALAREAALSARDEEIGRLREALAANLAARGNPVRFERTDVAFHYMLAEIAGNPIFTAIHQAMIDWLTEQRRTTLRVPGAEERAANSHQRIFAAVAAHDPDTASAEMAHHLDEVAGMYWSSEQTEPRATVP